MSKKVKNFCFILISVLFTCICFYFPYQKFLFLTDGELLTKDEFIDLTKSGWFCSAKCILADSDLDDELNEYVVKLESYKLKLTHLSPQYKVMQLKVRSDEAYTKLYNLMNQKLDNVKHKMDIYIEKLNGLSPLNKLKSGYSVVKNSDDKIIKNIDDIQKDDVICISVIDGDITAKTISVEKKIRNNIDER